MLQRMYTRWAEKAGHSARVVDRQPGQPSGLGGPRQHGRAGGGGQICFRRHGTAAALVHSAWCRLHQSRRASGQHTCQLAAACTLGCARWVPPPAAAPSVGSGARPPACALAAHALPALCNQTSILPIVKNAF